MQIDTERGRGAYFTKQKIYCQKKIKVKKRFEKEIDIIIIPREGNI